MKHRQEFLQLLIRAALYQRNEIVQYARAGDWIPLAKYIRGDGRITPQMRSFLADVLEGNERRPPRNTSRLATQKRNAEIARFILEAQERGEKEKEYSEAAEKKFGRTWRHLQKILAEQKRAEPYPFSAAHGFFDYAENQLQTAHLLPGGGVVWHPTAIPRSRIRSDGSVIRYRLSDMALSPHVLA